MLSACEELSVGDDPSQRGELCNEETSGLKSSNSHAMLYSFRLAQARAACVTKPGTQASQGACLSLPES